VADNAGDRHNSVGGRVVNVVALILIILAALLVVLVIGSLMARRRRSAALRNRFGPEYEHRLEERGDKRAVESELRDVSKRRESLEIRPLNPASRARYSGEWRVVQSRFVDQPDQAVTQADSLVAQVMRERGYPVEDFDDQMDMVAVDHPEVADNYRQAHVISVRNRDRLASTDDLRQALIHYRSLFEELLAESPASSPNTSSPNTPSPNTSSSRS
jgi:hypothetical protein